jgi:uncharacterized membrane protein
VLPDKADTGCRKDGRSKSLVTLGGHSAWPAIIDRCVRRSIAPAVVDGQCTSIRKQAYFACVNCCALMLADAPWPEPAVPSANAQPGLRGLSERRAIIIGVDDRTDEALRRLREELARRGLTLTTPGEGPRAQKAQRAPQPTQARRADEHVRGRLEAVRPTSRPWLRYTLLGLGAFAILPWLAPIFAAVGLWGAADPIYTLYMFLCHQLPERAATLFGYQVAFCWRNAALYGGLFGFGLLYAWSSGRRSEDPGLHQGLLHALLGKLPKAIPLWVYVLTLLPMALDGFSHMFGLREGLFTDSGFGSFLVGSQFLSLNWWLRVSTGLLAAFGSVWFTFPRLDRYIALSRTAAPAYRHNDSWAPALSGAWGSETITARLSPAGDGRVGESNE